MAQQPGIRAAIDTSDGLSSDLGHIIEQSGVGAILFADQIPISGELRSFCEQHNFDPVEYALSGGEDYTLICTMSPDEADAAAHNFQKCFKRPLFRMGEIREKKGLEIVFPDNSSKAIVSTGWNHFKDE